MSNSNAEKRCAEEACFEGNPRRAQPERTSEAKCPQGGARSRGEAASGAPSRRRLVPTGVDWIGDIPEGWKVIRVKYLASEGGTLFMDGDWINSDIIVEEGVRYLTSGPKDIARTQELLSVASIVGIRLQDHLVLAGERYVSLRESGLMSFG